MNKFTSKFLITLLGICAFSSLIANPAQSVAAPLSRLYLCNNSYTYNLAAIAFKDGGGLEDIEAGEWCDGEYTTYRGAAGVKLVIVTDDAGTVYKTNFDPKHQCNNAGYTDQDLDLNIVITPTSTTKNSSHPTVVVACYWNPVKK
jgi:hypothetical protein